MHRPASPGQPGALEGNMVSASDGRSEKRLDAWRAQANKSYCPSTRRQVGEQRTSRHLLQSSESELQIGDEVEFHKGPYGAKDCSAEYWSCRTSAQFGSDLVKCQTSFSSIFSQPCCGVVCVSRVHASPRLTKSLIPCPSLFLIIAFEEFRRKPLKSAVLAILHNDTLLLCSV